MNLDIKNRLTEIIISNPSKEWIDVVVTSNNKIHITVVSDYFKGQTKSKRKTELINLLPDNITLSIQSVYIYTTEEAQILDMHPPDQGEKRIHSWFDLVQFAKNDDKVQSFKKKEGFPRTVCFYSYKGGVGRTTALAHVAWILASRGNKVVVVDMDIEAPGIQYAFSSINPKPVKGFVDYLYERQNAINTNYDIDITDIFGEVPIDGVSGRLFVIPAGEVNFEYISKVDDLEIGALQELNLWETFLTDITNQLNPDIILIDSRTGINEWGAFSLIEAADDVLLFLYPNKENINGINGLLTALSVLENRSLSSINLILSKIPSNQIGKVQAKKAWDYIIDDIYGDNEEPLMVFYNSDIALADEYPATHLLSVYDPIANLIDEESERGRLKDILSGTNRWDIIKSLSFGTVDAKDQSHLLDTVFQKTADFDKFIDENTSVVHGQKGTGKTALYWMMLKYTEQVRNIARGRLDPINMVSGHGGFKGRPLKQEFRFWSKQFKERSMWEAFWRAYLLLRLYLDGELPPFRKNEFKPIRDELNKVVKTQEHWHSTHTNCLTNLTIDTSLSLKVKDYFTFLDDYFNQKEKRSWVIYDDLDEDIEEGSDYQLEALSGLFYFVRSLDSQKIRNLKCKVLIREDIWQRLNFTNKSHFNGRDVLLQWTRIDFLRLALRHAQSSRLYTDLVSRYSPVQDVDTATEDQLIDGLEILWGIRREKNRRSKYVSRWVYERLTDATGTTFPRSLGILLKAAKEHELSYQSQYHIQPPSDRLLRSQSLNNGLIEAAKQRSEEIRQEYPELEPVFDKLYTLQELCSEEEMVKFYDTVTLEQKQSFDDFVQKLERIGLLAREYVQGNEAPKFRFADIYVHGFEIKRLPRRKF